MLSLQQNVTKYFLGIYGESYSSSMKDSNHLGLYISFDLQTTRNEKVIAEHNMHVNRCRFRALQYGSKTICLRRLLQRLQIVWEYCKVKFNEIASLVKVFKEARI